MKTNRSQRRKPLQQAFDKAVDQKAAEKQKAWRAQWLEMNPPRAEIPISTGAWRHPDQTRQDNVYECELEPAKRPSSPLWRVPIAMSYFERRITMDLHRVDPMRVLDFRAVPMGLTAGDTRVRWWNWEPILGSLDAKVENEAMRAAHGAHAMMERLEPHVKMLAEMDPYGSRFMFANPGERHPLSGDIALKFWRESVELLGNWLGLVKTHYTVPGADGTPELRTSEARLP